jgi:hypothetical protein
MVVDTPWDLMRAGNQTEALRRLREANEQRDATSEIIELGVAHLWLMDYSAAVEHFESANRRYPKHTDVFYGMAGIAKWCLNEPREAVGQWRLGLDCRFADAAGGVGLPLLLFVASILRPDVMTRVEAEDVLRTRADDARIRIWPGPLAQFVLGRIDEAGCRRMCAGINESDTMLRRWRTDFYVGVLEHARGNPGRSRELMRRTATTFDDDFDLTKKHYLGKLWNEEFFIARHEAAGSAKGG